MPYHLGTAVRVRRLLASRPGVTEKRMVGGGLSFTVDGRMCCGVTATGLLVRVGRDGVAAALEKPHVGPMTLGGRRLSGFVLVDPEGYADDEALAGWVARGLATVAGLPEV